LSNTVQHCPTLSNAVQHCRPCLQAGARGKLVRLRVDLHNQLPKSGVRMVLEGCYSSDRMVLECVIMVSVLNCMINSLDKGCGEGKIMGRRGTTDSRQQTADSRQQTADKRGQTDRVGARMSTRGEAQACLPAKKGRITSLQCWTVLDSVGQCWTVLDSVGQCWTVLDSVGQCWTVFDSVGQCWTVLDSVRQCWTVLDSVRQCSTVLDRRACRRRRAALPA
jgi:hypothetical protein